MTMAAPVTPWKRARERGYPAIIAHKGGNGTRDFTAAVDAGADLVETDLWVHRGRFEARHERALYPIPLLYESRRPEYVQNQSVVHLRLTNISACSGKRDILKMLTPELFSWTKKPRGKDVGGLF